MARSRPLSMACTLLVAAATLTFGCRRPAPHATQAKGAAAQPSNTETIGGPRPLYLRVPQPAGPDQRFPLLVLLHGYGTDGPTAVEQLGYEKLASTARLVLAAPSGTRDRLGNRYWRAGPRCCDHFGEKPDHLGYLSRLIQRLIKRYPVDPRLVFVVGHSNGGHMAYALACQSASPVAAVAVVAGALLLPTCKTPAELSLLHVQGDADGIVPYAAATLPRPNGRQVTYPGASTSVRRFASARGCSPRHTVDAALLAGGRTVTRTHHEDCPEGSDVALWTIENGHHVDPAFTALAPRIWKWLLAHHRASPSAP